MPDLEVKGVGRLEDAGGDEVSFFAHPAYRVQLEATGAAAVIVARDFSPPTGCRSDLAWIRVDNPYLAVAEALRAFHPADRPAPGIHSTAVVAADAELGEGVHVAPRAVIGAGCSVGARTVVESGCVLGAGVRVGKDCHLHPNVTLYPGISLGNRVVVHAGAVIGADGFGYAQDGARQVKVPQVGTVEVEDDVEIGANACVDRATLGATRIGRGTKIDNLVQIGHNCRVGEHSVLCGQVGLGGSTVVGDGVMIGGQAGVRDHLRIGHGARVAGRSGVTDDVPDGARVAGFPHLEARQWRRAVAAVRRLPELLQRLRRLESHEVLQQKEGDR